jgi:tetratricopeptide (TPR) repeat protein
MDSLLVKAHEYRELALFLEDKYPDLYDININHPMANLATEAFVVNPNDIYDIADTLMEFDDYHKAEPLYRMLLTHYTDDKTIIALKQNLGECLFNIHQIDKTEDCSEVGVLWHSVVDHYMATYGNKHKDTVDVIVDLVNYYAYIKNYDKAMEYFESIVSVHHQVESINYTYFVFSYAELIKEMMHLGKEINKERQVLYNIGCAVFNQQPRLMKKLIQMLGL